MYQNLNYEKKEIVQFRMVEDRINFRFAKLKELSRTVSALSEANEQDQKSLMQKSSELIADLLDDEQKVTNSETTIELNLAVLKVKHTVKRKAEKE